MLKRLKSFLFKMVLILLIAPVVLVGVVKYVDPPIWGWKLSR
ncbi:monofunctional biosynthetic peptidoglycan transglycosylase, partial [Vibrio diabolicus]